MYMRDVCVAQRIAILPMWWARSRAGRSKLEAGERGDASGRGRQRSTCSRPRRVARRIGSAFEPPGVTHGVVISMRLRQPGGACRAGRSSHRGRPISLARDTALNCGALVPGRPRQCAQIRDTVLPVSLRSTTSVQKIFTTRSHTRCVHSWA
jgi:hypothetical protein|eukprot:3819880-Prymnesium_polylepis.2